MHFEGQQLVSRPTHVSARTLVTLAGAQIFAALLPIDMEQFTIMGVRPGADNIGVIAASVTGFLVVGHIFNWLVDFRAFPAWNSEKKVSGKAIWGFDSTPLRSELDVALGRLGTLASTLEKYEKAPKDAKMRENVVSKLKETLRRIEDLQKSIGRLTRVAKAYFFGWILTVPVGLGFWAIWLSLS